jgi:hypothetical protein
MKSRPDLERKLLVVFLLFFALLQFPLISIFNRPLGVGHWPLLFVFLLVAWISLIIVLYLLLEGNPFKSKSGK